MERDPTARLIPLESISSEFPFGIRYKYEDPILGASLERRGILFPIFAAKGKEGPAVVVSGHKRFYWAAKKRFKKIPAVLIEEKFSGKELFLLSLLSNWNQAFTELDRMTAVQRAERDFRFSSEELQKEILPSLGLPPGRRVLEEYLRAGELISEIHQLIHAQKLPFRGAALLARFSKEEQIRLAQSLLGRTHLSSNQLALLGGWLLDLKKMHRVPLDELLCDKTIREAVNHPKMDGRARADRLFEAVRRLRFPRLSKEEKNFLRLKNQLESPGQIQIERPGGLEGEGVLLRARLRNRESLDRVVQFLEEHQASLESLFDSGI